VTLGPFGTNGNAKLVIVEYTASEQGAISGNNAGNLFNNTGTLQLYRKIGAGAEALWHTIPLTGQCNHYAYEEFNDSTLYESVLQGALSTTDNDVSMGNRTYRAVLTARSMHHGPSSQVISVRSTEE
jgi:trimeric autotransporter adhesin